MILIHILLMIVALVAIIANLIATIYGINEVVEPKWVNRAVMLNLVIHFTLLFIVERYFILNLIAQN